MARDDHLSKPVAGTLATDPPWSGPMKAWHRRGPLVMCGGVSGQLCAALLDRFREAVPRPRSYQGVVDNSQRRCDFVSVDADDVDPELSWLCTAVVEPSLGVLTRSIAGQPMMLYRYPQGVGFVTHHDEVTEVETERGRTNGQPILYGDITVVVGLNPCSDYEGGELFFEDPDLVVKLDEGTVVAFPATHRFVHGVRPVVAGERLSLIFRVDVECQWR